MIDETLSNRMEALKIAGMRRAFQISLNAVQADPETAAQFIRENLESCEDLEIAFDRMLDRKIENILPMHSCL